MKPTAAKPSPTMLNTEPHENKAHVRNILTFKITQNMITFIFVQALLLNTILVFQNQKCI